MLIACLVLLQVFKVEFQILQDLHIVLHDDIDALGDTWLYCCRTKTVSVDQRKDTLSDVNR